MKYSKINFHDDQNAGVYAGQTKRPADEKISERITVCRTRKITSPFSK